MSNYLRAAIVALLFTPFLVFAQIDVFIDMFTGWVMMIIPLLMSLAVIVFFWGIVKFIAQAENEQAHEEGKNLMIWGMIALFVMVGLWGIVGYLQDTFQLGGGATSVGAPNIPIQIPQ